MASNKWVWRGMAIFAFILAVSLVFALPYKMRWPDDWAYYYAVKNFSQGKLVVSDELHRQQLAEAEEQGGKHMQYVKLSDGNWALEKAPGYPFVVVPFEWLGIPRAANVYIEG